MEVSDALADRSVPPALATFFGVVVDPDTYRSLLYLFLAFPLGIMYFTVLVTLLALVADLWPVGVVLVPLVLLAVHGLGWFERGLVVYVLGMDVPSADRPLQWLRGAVREPPAARALARQAGALAVAPRTWTRSVVVAAKFPVGVVAFVVLTVLGSVTTVLMAAPFLYDVPGARLQVLRPVVTVVAPAVERAGVSVGGTPTLAISGTVTEVETLPGALATSAGGVLVGVGSLHLLHWLARGYGWLTALLVSATWPDRPRFRRT